MNFLQRSTRVALRQTKPLLASHQLCTTSHANQSTAMQLPVTTAHAYLGSMVSSLSHPSYESEQPSVRSTSDWMTESEDESEANCYITSLESKLMCLADKFPAGHMQVHSMFTDEVQVVVRGAGIFTIRQNDDSLVLKSPMNGTCQFSWQQ